MIKEFKVPLIRPMISNRSLIKLEAKVNMAKEEPEITITDHSKSDLVFNKLYMEREVVNYQGKRKIVTGAPYILDVIENPKKAKIKELSLLEEIASHIDLGVNEAVAKVVSDHLPKYRDMISSGDDHLWNAVVLSYRADIPDWFALYLVNAQRFRNPNMWNPYGLDSPASKITLSAVDFLRTYRTRRNNSAKVAVDRSFEYLAEVGELDSIVLESDVIPALQKIKGQTRRRWHKGMKPDGIKQLHNLADIFGINLPISALNDEFYSVLALATYAHFQGRIQKGYETQISFPTWSDIDEQNPLESLDSRLGFFPSKIVKKGKNRRYAVIDSQGALGIGRLLNVMGVAVQDSRTVTPHPVLSPVATAMKDINDPVLQELIGTYFEIWAYTNGRESYKKSDYLEISFPGQRLPLPSDYKSNKYASVSQTEPQDLGFNQHLRLVQKLFPDQQVTSRFNRFVYEDAGFYTKQFMVRIKNPELIYERFPRLRIHQERKNDAKTT